MSFHLQAPRDEVVVSAGHAEDIPPADGGGHPRPASHRQDVWGRLSLLTSTPVPPVLEQPRTRDNLIDLMEPPCPADAKHTKKMAPTRECWKVECSLLSFSV